MAWRFTMTRRDIHARLGAGVSDAGTRQNALLLLHYRRAFDNIELLVRTLSVHSLYYAQASSIRFPRMLTSALPGPFSA